MNYLSNIIGKPPLGEQQLAQTYQMLSSNVDGKITYKEIKFFISDFIYIINGQSEPQQGEISEDPYILKKMIKKLKKQISKKKQRLAIADGREKEAEHNYTSFQKHYIHKPPEEEMRLMQEMDILQEQAK